MFMLQLYIAKLPGSMSSTCVGVVVYGTDGSVTRVLPAWVRERQQYDEKEEV